MVNGIKMVQTILEILELLKELNEYVFIIDKDGWY